MRSTVGSGRAAEQVETWSTAEQNIYRSAGVRRSEEGHRYAGLRATWFRWVKVRYRVFRAARRAQPYWTRPTG
ncbi:hypothetical protein HBB16_13540 [Pseudonocardia sp. MCCB 268]|nr:hypothetical protein [Pseudonocardia cytotoxica]